MANNKPPQSVINAGVLFQLSIAIVVAILVPLLVGIWLVNTFHLNAIVMIILIAIGLLIGSMAVYRIVKDAYARLGGGK